MHLTEALRRRRMVRAHTGDPVPPEVLERIVTAALGAPSAGRSQGVALITVTQRTQIAAVAAECGEATWVASGRSPWISSSGALLVVCLEPEVYRARYMAPDKDPAVLQAVPWWWVDGGASLMAILLAAVDAGLGAGFLGGHRTAGLHRLLGIPDEVLVLGVVTLGPEAPGVNRVAPGRRRDRADRVHTESW